VHHYLKSHFPTSRVYGPVPTPELRLITCGGLFDPSRGSYLSNVVVYATLIAPRPGSSKITHRHGPSRSMRTGIPKASGRR
jgi:hypothetical protein